MADDRDLIIDYTLILTDIINKRRLSKSVKVKFFLLIFFIYSRLMPCPISGDFTSKKQFSTIMPIS